MYLAGAYSTVSCLLMLQFENPTKGDWASSCIQDLEDLGMNLTLNEIKNLSKYTYSKLIKKSIQDKALEYLNEKKRSKGQEIEYKEIKMADYLSPGYGNITINDQRNIFAIRNRMVVIPANFKNDKSLEKCACGEPENMKHIYTCKLWNKGRELEIEYEEIFENDVSKQLKISKIFFQNLEEREKQRIKNEKTKVPHEIQQCDPLSSLTECTVMDYK